MTANRNTPLTDMFKNSFLPIFSPKVYTRKFTHEDFLHMLTSSLMIGVLTKDILSSSVQKWAISAKLQAKFAELEKLVRLLDAIFISLDDISKFVENPKLVIDKNIYISYIIHRLFLKLNEKKSFFHIS